MSKYLLPAAIAVAAGAYIFKDRLFGSPPTKGDIQTQEVKSNQAGGGFSVAAAPATPPQLFGMLTPAQRAARIPVASPPPPAGQVPGGAIGTQGMSARDYGTAIGGTAAAAGCAAAGAAIAAPLCGAAGAALGGYAVDGGKAAGKAIGQAADKVGSWVKGIF